jgi:hypothetical protein
MDPRTRRKVRDLILILTAITLLGTVISWFSPIIQPFISRILIYSATPIPTTTPITTLTQQPTPTLPPTQPTHSTPASLPTRQMPSQNSVLSDLQALPDNSADIIQVSPLSEGNGDLLVCYSSNGGNCRFKARLYGGLLELIRKPGFGPELKRLQIDFRISS